jgi:hypothetical protein
MPGGRPPARRYSARAAVGGHVAMRSTLMTRTASDHAAGAECRPAWRLRAFRPEIRRGRRWKANAGLRAEVGGLPYDRAVAVNDFARQNAMARIDALQALVHALPVGSPIAAVLTDAYLQEQRKWVGGEANLENAEWPPLLGWTIAAWLSDEISLLDSDIQMVRDHPTSDPVQATAWLSAKRGESRKLRAGLVETTAKARALAFADASDIWTVTARR